MTLKNGWYLRRIDDLGQVAIPKEIRDLNGIKDGDYLEVSSVEIEKNQVWERYVLLKLSKEDSE